MAKYDRLCEYLCTLQVPRRLELCRLAEQENAKLNHLFMRDS